MNLTGTGMLITKDGMLFLDIKYATLENNNEIEISGNIISTLEKQPFRKEVDRRVSNPGIKKVIFNDPVTVVIWDDDTKTIVKCQPGDTYDAEKGLALCIAKKYFGNKGNFNEVFKKWVPEDNKTPVEKESIVGTTEETVDYMRSTIRRYCYERMCSKCVIRPLLERGVVTGCYSRATKDDLITNYEAVKKTGFK